MLKTLLKAVTLDFLRSSGGGDDDDERRAAEVEVDNNSENDVSGDDDEKKPAAAKDDATMGDSCSKVPSPPTLEADEDNDAKPAAKGNDAIQASSPAAGSKRSRDGKFSSLRRSIFRVGSRVDRGGNNAFATGSASSDMNGVPHSPRARASTYSHVHDAVMYNLSEAETSKHDQSVPMGESNEWSVGHGIL